MDGRFGRAALAGWVSTVLACSGPAVAPNDAAPATDTAPVTDASLTLRGLDLAPRAFTPCPDADSAPLRTGDDVDAVRCTPVGPITVPSPPRWPDTRALAAPTLFVDPAAASGGTGTLDAPLRTIAEALRASPPAASIALARGTHPLTATLTLTRDLTLVGVGATNGTTLEIPRGQIGLQVAPNTRLTLRGVTLQYASAAPRTEQDLALLATQSTLSLQDLLVADAEVGITLDGGTLDATRLAVVRPRRTAVLASGGAFLSLTRFVLRDGLGQGLRAEGAHVALREGLVTRMARHGMVLIGATTATGGRPRCDASDRGGALDCVDQVVSQGNGVAGLYVADARRTEVRRSTFADTVLTPIDGGEAGDGIFVGAEADVSLDPELISPAVRGFGSALLGNGRAGILAQGLRARLSVRGAVLSRNASGGLFVGARAEVPAVGESLFVENRFAGIVATPGSLVGIVQCNGIVDTAAGTLRGSTVTVQLGDGVHLNASSARVSMEENTILRSSAFGLLVNASTLSLRANRGADNRFGVGTYGGASVDGDARTIAGREASPPVAPGLAVGP
jgi:hypothetical protein